LWLTVFGFEIPTFLKPKFVAQCEKSTSELKMNDNNKIPTALSGMFACPNAQWTICQSKESEFCERHITSKIIMIEN
jgi:hypothetical protein